MNLSDTFYIALCMTVLILGVVYWFWTQNQYIQRKLNLLENIVYEMKTTLNAQASAPDAVDAVLSNVAAAKGPDVLGAVTEEASYPPPPGSELGEDEDLLHEELSAEASADAPAEVPQMFTMPEAEDNTEMEDLQPGGVGSGIQEEVHADSSAKSNVLDGMTRAQLKRLAEQRGIAVKATMSRQAMIEAIRVAPISSPFDTHEATISLS